MLPPSRSELIAKLTELAEARTTREEASAWAGQWLADDAALGVQSPFSDRAAWDTLIALAGADLYGGDRPYLYGQEDFGSWAATLRAAPA